MCEKLNINDIYEQNINFLFGSGASYGAIPTLALKIRDSNGVAYTFESLAKVLDDKGEKELYSLLFMHYYNECILPGISENLSPTGNENRNSVLNEYILFLKTLNDVLERKGKLDRKCNIYTTNYDCFFEEASDCLVHEERLSFVVNDGSDGFKRKRFHIKNFNNRVIRKGFFDRDGGYINQVNLLHIHGSVYWVRDGEEIKVDYGIHDFGIDFNEIQKDFIKKIKEIVEDGSKLLSDLIAIKGDFESESKELDFDGFMSCYKKIPIVNPTKWKFHETVFEEAYYQQLRHLSFELERPNSALITFGFSFSDEHILSLIQRALSNPSLTLYICCYNELERERLNKKFIGYKNLKYIYLDEDLNFKIFNKKIFTLTKDDC